ncbi:MAG: hypothetical protein QXF26_01125 [Candidatus Bathyarchaeia archaeon]
MVIVGIDVGGSLTKAVILEGGAIVAANSVRTVEDPLVSASGILARTITSISLSLRDVEKIGVAGGKSRQLPDDILGIEVERVGEIEAIGLGGLKLSDKREGVVVSAGTGTAIVRVMESGSSIEHIGGTGVGGGTLLGLSRAIAGIDDPNTLSRYASTGNPRKVDLTVGDVVGSGIGVLNAETTASNFGRFSGDATREDLISAVFRMVGEVIGVVSCLAARASGVKDVVLVGALSKMDVIVSVVREVFDLYGLSLIVPPYSEYAVAVGAATKASGKIF